MSPLKISIIIPSFNQAAYIEHTLHSVLDQKYPSLELIVMDGGSTDGSVDIIRRHEAWITNWRSEPDRGQSHAINKGLALCTGDVWSYLNSDDLIYPGSLNRIAELFCDPATDWVGAVSSIFDHTGEIGEVRPVEAVTMKEVLAPWNRKAAHVFPCSNVNFMRRSVYERIGGFDESFSYSMDMEYYTRAMFAGYLLRRVPDVLGTWRWHAESKTLKQGQAFRFLEEELRIAHQYVDRLPESDQNALTIEIREQTRWFRVRRALNASPAGSRWSRLFHLLADASYHPSLLTFRPWLGAVKQLLLRP